MRAKAIRDILSRLRGKRGCSLEELGYGFLLGQWLYTDPVPYGGSTSAQHPLVRLVRLGLVEVFRHGKPVKHTELSLSGPDLADLTFWFSKRAVEVEEALGIRLDQAASLFAETAPAAKWPDVFVVMPFSDELRHVYAEHVRPTVTGLGLSVSRADDFFGHGAIVNDIWGAVKAARLVVADCTGRNANVFYEIGLAHAIGTTTVLLTQSLEDIPFDLRHLRVLVYRNSKPGLRALDRHLKEVMVNLISDGSDNI